MCDGIRVYEVGMSQKSGFWRLVAFTVALLFGLSNFFVQSHVHVPTLLTIGAPASPGHVLGSNAASKQRPSKDDPADCPLCQADIMSGAFVAPAPIVFVPIISYVLINILPSVYIVWQTTWSYSWQGRAPPSL